ncbi:MAG: hypothetical protein O4965_30205 [Trichodesmium sp. St19_bin1]|nr:hypothetical protein [Trichodesmium sp. St19_bin1]
MRYPSIPEPHTIEVEATNHCSARRSFCPHPRMKRSKGFLDIECFQKFIGDRYLPNSISFLFKLNYYSTYCLK